MREVKRRQKGEERGETGVRTKCDAERAQYDGKRAACPDLEIGAGPTIRIDNPRSSPAATAAVRPVGFDGKERLEKHVKLRNEPDWKSTIFIWNILRFKWL
jgi:hypothetical protein